MRVGTPHLVEIYVRAVMLSILRSTARPIFFPTKVFRARNAARSSKVVDVIEGFPD